MIQKFHKHARPGFLIFATVAIILTLAVPALTQGIPVPPTFPTGEDIPERDWGALELPVFDASTDLVNDMSRLSALTELDPMIDQPEFQLAPYLEAVLNNTYDGSSEQLEIDFMNFMIVHHDVAVLMGYLCVERTVHEELRGLCPAIANAQALQITQQNFYLADWYKMFQSPTMLEQDEYMVAMLLKLYGDEFDKRFLWLMTHHHGQAVVAAEPCAAGVPHYLLESLCQSMIYVQE